MMKEELPNAALSEDEISEILRAGGKDAIVVGGQALAIWASFYQVVPPAVLSQEVTRDADFLGTLSTAMRIQAALSNKAWILRRVKAGSLTPVTAQLLLREETGVKEIDFLGSIAGLDTEAVRRRAVPLNLADGTVVTVLHPLDVLASRLHNLAEIEEKRNAKGVAQAQLAISVAGAFLREQLEGAPEREVLGFMERVGAIAAATDLVRVCIAHGFDVLACVPVAQIKNANFRRFRWPQIRHEVEEAMASIGGAADPATDTSSGA
jgi:hypothetical protein